MLLPLVLFVMRCVLSFSEFVVIFFSRLSPSRLVSVAVVVLENAWVIRLVEITLFMVFIIFLFFWLIFWQFSALNKNLKFSIFPIF